MTLSNIAIQTYGAGCWKNLPVTLPKPWSNPHSFPMPSLAALVLAHGLMRRNEQSERIVYRTRTWRNVLKLRCWVCWDIGLVPDNDEQKRKTIHWSMITFPTQLVILGERYTPVAGTPMLRCDDADVKTTCQLTSKVRFCAGLTLTRRSTWVPRHFFIAFHKLVFLMPPESSFF